MMRTVAAVIVGYLAMALVIFATFSAAYLAMGADAAFKPGSYDVTMLWIVVSFVLGFLAALVAGNVAASISTSSRAPQVLAGAVLVITMLAALPELTSKEAPKPRTGNVSNMAAMQSARNPVWFALLIPITGAFGVLIGAGIRRRKAVRAEVSSPSGAPRLQ